MSARSVGAAAPAKQPGRFRATVAEGAVQTDSKPPAAAGVRVGDTITAVDGKDVAGWRCYLVFGLLSAKADTSIQLTLGRGDTVMLTAVASP